MKIADTVKHFLADCQVKGRTEYTLSSYKQHLGMLVQLLMSMFNISELEQVTIKHLRQCVQHLMGVELEIPSNCFYPGYQQANGASLAVSSVRAYVRIFKVFFTWCYQEDLIDVNPVARLTAPKPATHIVSTFKPEHIEKMLSVCDLSTEMGFRDYVILLLLLDTGMRLGEISNLRVTDVHDTYIKVFGKGRKEREIGLHPEVSKLLWKYVHKHRRPKNPDETALFLGCGRGNGKPLTYDGVRGVIDRIQEVTGLTDIKFSPHVFRHTFAKMYLESGGEVFKLSREMGHSHVQVTEIYLKDFGSTEARKEHTAFSPISSIQLRRNIRRKKMDE
jgi:integrase/recombinase XerD